MKTKKLKRKIFPSESFFKQIEIKDEAENFEVFRTSSEIFPFQLRQAHLK